MMTTATITRRDRLHLWDRPHVAFVPGIAALVATASCGGVGTGAVQFYVEAESTITDGLSPGTDLESVTDGWAVTYDKFLITLGNVSTARSANPGLVLDQPTLQIVDMRNLPPSGLALAEFDNIEATRWDKVGYDQGYAGATALKPAGTSQADFDMMVAGAFSLYVSGTIVKDGQPTVAFAWGLKSGVAWSDCGPEMGDKGFAVASGGTTPVKLTIHGDHWFFDNFPEGQEITHRRAQWVADVDALTGGDHLVTTADLAAVRASAVFPLPRYSLQNALGAPITNALDFVTTQARTIGHLQGEGECDSLTPL